MKSTLPVPTTWKDGKYINVIWTSDSGRAKRVILDPGGAEEVTPMQDGEGRIEETFCFYRHFQGRAWEYRAR